MARTPSIMLELGTKAPLFDLVEPKTGIQISNKDFEDSPLLIAFICNHCPFVVLIKEELAKFANDYHPKGLSIVAINSNDVENYPGDSPDKMIEFAEESGFTFPYLYDESQSVAKAYQAACTPDFFLFNGDGELFYRGQFDGARPGNDKTNDGRDMRAAADAVLAQSPAPENQIASLGCGIKWKPGNSPSYA